MKTKSSRDKISEAALLLFTEKGIKSTTTKRIAKKAGVAEGTIYIHFKSKDALAYGLFVEHMNYFRDLLEQSIIIIEEPDKALGELINNFYSFANNEPVKYQYIIMGHHTELQKMPVLKTKPKDIFVDVIKKGIKDRSFRDMDPNIAASYVIGMITRSILFYKNGMIECSYEDLVSTTKENVNRLLLL